MDAVAVSYCRPPHDPPPPPQVRFQKEDRPIAVSAGRCHSAALVEVERADERRELCIFVWGKDKDGRLAGVDCRNHATPQESMDLTRFLRKRRVRPHTSHTHTTPLSHPTRTHHHTPASLFPHSHRSPPTRSPAAAPTPSPCVGSGTAR